MFSLNIVNKTKKNSNFVYEPLNLEPVFFFSFFFFVFLFHEKENVHSWPSRTVKYRLSSVHASGNGESTPRAIWISDTPGGENDPGGGAFTDNPQGSAVPREEGVGGRGRGESRRACVLVSPGNLK